MNCTRNAARKVNCTRLRLVQFISFLIALLVQFIPNFTATHAITYTNCDKKLHGINAIMSEKQDTKAGCELTFIAGLGQ